MGVCWHFTIAIRKSGVVDLRGRTYLSAQGEKIERTHRKAGRGGEWPLAPETNFGVRLAGCNNSARLVHRTRGWPT
jgi:hypothetical protein